MKINLNKLHNICVFLKNIISKRQEERKSKQPPEVYLLCNKLKIYLSYLLKLSVYVINKILRFFSCFL